MDHTQKCESNLEKLVTLGKTGHTWKKSHTWKNGSHLIKRVALKKVGHTRKKVDTLGTMGHTSKDGPNLVK